MKFLGKLILAIIAIFVVKAMFTDKESDASPASSGSAHVVQAAMPVPQRQPSSREIADSAMPADERAFIAAVSKAQRDAASAANEMQKGGVRARRATEICNIIKGSQITNWTGLASTISSNGDGKGVLGIEIAKNIALKTWNNALSDSSDRTLIEPSSAVFQVASNLTKGKPVSFSGTLIKSQTDCIRETSMSLAGSLSDPEFVIRFSSISPMN